MITDAFNLFSNAQPIAGAANVTSANIIDLSAPRDIANGHPVRVFFDVVTSFSQTGTGTITFEVVTDTSPLFTANPTVIFSSGPVAIASLLTGTAQIQGYIAYDAYQGERYVEALYVIGGGATVVTGAITAGLVIELQADEYYPSGINVSGV